MRGLAVRPGLHVGAVVTGRESSGTRWVYDDGGRAAAGYRGQAGDCVCRAIAIAEDRPYADVYGELNDAGRDERQSRRRPGRSSARTGVYRNTIHAYLSAHGWYWTSTMRIGSGCTVHLLATELPRGRSPRRNCRGPIEAIDFQGPYKLQHRGFGRWVRWYTCPGCGAIHCLGGKQAPVGEFRCGRPVNFKPTTKG